MPGSTSLAAESLWKHLAQSGSTLDIMGIEAMADHIMLVGTKYEEVAWSPSADATTPEQTSIVRKQLYVMRINKQELVDWQQDYSALPDAQEIFSIANSNDQRLCIVYGEQQEENQALNPVLLQINNDGKIFWATRDVMANLHSSPSIQPELVQIANLDTIKVSGTPDGGCLLSYVTRHLTADNETFLLNVVNLGPDGSEKWRRIVPTQLYGRMFLRSDRDAGQYVLVQTNQSRDAAIQAMMLATAFRPQTAITAIDAQGNIVYQYEKLPELEKVWVSAVSVAPGSRVLLAGRSRSSWVGFVNKEGKVVDIIDQLDGEYHAATTTPSGGFALARGEYLTVTDSRLMEKGDQKISAIIRMQYINQYLTARLPDDLPVQQILALSDNEFLVLYKLGSKLLKLNLKNPH